METVFITTREREFHLRKALPKWAEEEVEIRLVIERRELDSHLRLLDELEVDATIDTLRANNRGLGWIREEVLKLAEESELDGFLLADDDLYPSSGDPRMLVEVARDREVVGCGGTNSYHGLMLGNNEILKTGLAFPIAGGWGHRIVGINTELARESGGYPIWNVCLGSDTELQRQGIAMGKPWWVHTGFRFGSLGARYTKGGHNSLLSPEARKKRELICHKRMRKIWGDYISEPGKPYRCQWKKMMNDYIPDWAEQVPAEITELREAK